MGQTYTEAEIAAAWAVINAITPQPKLINPPVEALNPGPMASLPEHMPEPVVEYPVMADSGWKIWLEEHEFGVFIKLEDATGNVVTAWVEAEDNPEFVAQVERYNSHVAGIA